MIRPNVRVVHVLSPRHAGDEGVLACRAAMDIPTVQHLCIVLGTAADEQRAWTLGIVSQDRLTPPRAPRLSTLAQNRVRAILRARLADHAGPTILCGWSIPDLHLIRAAAGKHGLKRLGVLTQPTPQGDASLSDFALDEATVLAVGEAVRSSIARPASARRGGWLCRDDIRVSPAPVFERGGPRMGEANAPVDRSALRHQLGLDPGDGVVGLLAGGGFDGRSESSGDALTIAFQLGLCSTLGHALVGLVPRGSSHVRQAIEFVRDHGRLWRILPVDLTMPEIIAASDVALAQVNDAAPSCGLTALSLCAAMGVPVACAPGVIEHFHHFDDAPPALLAPSDERNRLAISLLELVQNSSTAADLVRRQRAWCDRARAHDWFRSTLAALWAEMANVPVLCADLPVPTALSAATISP